LSFSNKYFSHPGKALIAHLLNVGENSFNIFSEKNLNIDNISSKKILSEVSYLIGVCHDFGKLTSFFQNYINETDGTVKRKLKSKRETNHGLISAVFVYYIVRDYLDKKNLKNTKFYEYLPVIAFLTVRRHHGDLNNAIDDAIIEKEDVHNLVRQIDAINLEDAQKIYNELFLPLNYTFDLNTLKTIVSALKEKTFPGKRKLRNIDEEKTLLFYFITLLLYSVLLYSDKSDAANLSKLQKIKLPEDLVDNFKQIKFKQNDKCINKIRDDIYKEVINNVQQINLEKEKILSLNVPTGSGKTLTSLSFALKLRERINKEKKYSPKIIYSLPFLSIIDQNYDIANKMLFNPTTDILLKHHHLSDIFYNTKENQFKNINNDIGKDLLQIEGWNSEIIFTTFIQFFYSIITNRNRAVRKFHNIVNSIVIFDEVQAIPHKYWLLLKETVSFFAKYFNTYFIFMTATQPLIVEEIKSLVENKEKYFDDLNRFDFFTNLEEIKINNFIEQLIKDLSDNSEKDFLIVLNTIKTSINVYEKLKEKFGNSSKLFYLSTNIVPKKRLQLIKNIRKRSKKRKIIVSTQVVEAGIDLDVDFVYRDFAPLDSLNQVAGRCNRNFEENEKGKVKIFNIYNIENERKYFPKMIYDKFLISKTEDVFKDVILPIEEKDFLKLTAEYYKKVNEGMADDESRNILQSVYSLKFSELSKFRLIENDYPKIDIFIGLNKKAKNVWQKYKSIKGNESLTGLEKRNEFLKIKRKFNDYIISVPEKYAPPGFEKGRINFISKDEIPSYYDLETGFKRDIAGKGMLAF